jgi:hypothetical protein
MCACDRLRVCGDRVPCARPSRGGAERKDASPRRPAPAHLARALAARGRPPRYGGQVGRRALARSAAGGGVDHTALLRLEAASCARHRCGDHEQRLELHARGSPGPELAVRMPPARGRPPPASAPPRGSAEGRPRSAPRARAAAGPPSGPRRSAPSSPPCRDDRRSSSPTPTRTRRRSVRVDACRFERLATEGREALTRGAARRAAERLRAAVALWRGHPYGELGDEGALRREADRLEDLRLLALEERIEADLQRIRAAERLRAAVALWRGHPYSELWSGRTSSV